MQKKVVIGGLVGFGLGLFVHDVWWAKQMDSYLPDPLRKIEGWQTGAALVAIGLIAAVVA